MRIIVSLLAAVMMLVAGAANAAMLARDGEFFFRYKGGPSGAAPVSVITPFDADVTARFVGVVDYEFSEKIPMVPGKPVKRWDVVDGEIPEGITFDSSAGLFSGTPVAEIRGMEAYLQGYDASGHASALAKVTFDIFQPRDQLAKVDFYAHTNRFRFEQLPVPSDMTVDHWNVIFSPPPGVDVIGRNYDGTPSREGRYPVAVQGFDYLDREIILLVGYYLVEDGPTFSEVADDLQPISPQLGHVTFDKRPPFVRSVSQTAGGGVEFDLEIAEGETLPGTTQLASSSGEIMGDVFYPYQTASVRWKATDVDGTVGFSNWFEFGTSYPTPSFSDNPLGPFYGVVDTPLTVAFSSLGTSGNKTFSVKQGSLPEGLRLEGETGRISGSPVKAERQDDIVISLDIENGGTIDTIETVPFSFIIDDQEVGIDISMASPSARMLLSQSGAGQPAKTRLLLNRVDADMSLQVKAVGAVFEPAIITVDPKHPLPQGLTFNRDTGLITGSVSQPGQTMVRFRLINGNGKEADASVVVGIYNPLTVGPINDIHIARYDLIDVPVDIGIDPLGIMPDRNGRIAVDVRIVGTAPEGIAYSPEMNGLVGGTSSPEGIYGPLKVSVTDGSGESVLSNEFYIHVMPRKGITMQVEDVKSDLSKRSVSPVVKVTRPPLSQSLRETYSLAAGTLPEGVTVDPVNGDLIGYPATTGTWSGLKLRVQDSEGFAGTSEAFSLVVGPAGDLGVRTRADIRIPINHPSSITPSSVSFAVGAATFGSAKGLPDGLSMAEDGTVTGSATTLGTYPVEFVVSDAAGRQKIGKFNVAVIERPNLKFAGDGSTLNVAQYETRSWNLVAENVIGSKNYEIVKGTLPTGFKLSQTGQLSGKSDEKGVFSGITVRVTDGETGLRADLTFTVNVGNRKPLEISYASPTTVYVNADVGLPVLPKVNNARGAVSYRLASGVIPAGMSFDPSDGSLRGVPSKTAINRDVTVVGTDADGVTSSFTFDIIATKFGPLSSPSQTYLVYRIGEAFTTPDPGFANYVDPITYSLTSPLPAGIAFDAGTGRITGSFADVVSHDILMTATDVHGRNAMAATRINIRTLDTVRVLTQPGSVQIYQYANESSAIGAVFGNLIGKADYALTGSLPEGLSFSKDTGAITGKAAQAGTFANLTITATDSHDGRSSTTSPFTITVLPRKPLGVILPATVETLANRSITDIAVATVENPAYGRKVAFTYSGNLPEGVTFNATKGSFSGAASVLGDFPNIRVTATDSVGASATSQPMIIRSILNGQQIFLTVADIRTHVGWSFSTPEPIATNHIGRLNFYSYDLVPEISLSATTGVMSGVFARPYDFEFDLYVADDTARVTSDRMKVEAVPDIRVVYPSMITAPQAQSMMEISPDVFYAVGRKSFSKGGSTPWPEGIDLDPETGRISGAAETEGTYAGLTVDVTDTLAPNSMKRASNTFSIVVSEFTGKPVIQKTVSNWVQAGLKFDVDKPAQFRPTVTDSILGKTWSFAGTVYSINKSLPDGLHFDPATGEISGTATTPGVLEGVVITVTSRKGDSSATNPFWLGIQPKGELTLATDPYEVSGRPGQTVTFPAPVRGNSFGRLNFVKIQADQPWVSIDSESGAITASLPSDLAPSSNWMSFAAYDQFGRFAGFNHIVRVVAAPTISYDSKVFVLNDYDSLAPKASNILEGTIFSIAPSLPQGLSINTTTGVISGTAVTETAALDYTVTLTDSGGTVTSKPFSISVGAETPAPTHRMFMLYLSGRNTNSGDGARIGDIAAVASNGSELIPSRTYMYGKGYATDAIRDGNHATYLYDDTAGGGIAMEFDAGAPVAKIRLKMVGQVDAKNIRICTGESYGWSVGGYFQPGLTNCTPQTVLAAPVSGDAQYAPGEVIEIRMDGSSKSLGVR